MMSRGNEKQNIFRSRSDRKSYLKILGEVSAEHDWRIFTYCLMNNHFHLVLETPGATLSAGMKYLNGVYSQLFNARHGRVGHLFQGRYASRLIENDEYVLALQRYILQNPVRAGFCLEVGQWEWSSYRATALLSPSPTFLDTDFILGFFSDGSNPQLQYAAYVNGRSEPGPWMAAAFDRNAICEMVELGSIIRSPHDKRRRNVEIIDAFESHGFTMTEIAAHLQMSQAAISKIIGRRRGGVS